MATYKFRSGHNPLENVKLKTVKSRIARLSDEYAPAISAGKRLFSTQVSVWAVTFDAHNVPYFASAKMVGYVDSIEAYFRAKADKTPMTGVDAVIGLRKMGFIDCEPDEIPELEERFKVWLAQFDGTYKKTYRFIIHRSDIAKVSDNIRDIAVLFRECTATERKALSGLVEEHELEAVY